MDIRNDDISTYIIHPGHNRKLLRDFTRGMAGKTQAKKYIIVPYARRLQTKPFPHKIPRYVFAQKLTKVLHRKPQSSKRVVKFAPG